VAPYTSTTLSVVAPLFAERLADSMATAKVSVRDLAEQSGVDKDTINQWRHGRRKAVTVELVRQLAPLLNTTAERLLDMPEPDGDAPEQPPSPAAMPDLERAEQLVVELARLLAAARKPVGEH
jgi:transcriptional regulator with XRE-family HTH domain